MGLIRSGRRAAAVLVVAAAGLSACVSPNDIAMQIGAPPNVGEGKTTVDLRAMQTRRFDTLDERRLMQAAIQTLQDLGYTVTESSLDSGVLVASKQRDAEEGGQVAGAIMMSVVFAALGAYTSPTWDKEQTIVVTLTTSPLKNSPQTDVRVSFDRRLINNYGHLWRSENILDAKIYQEFFGKLAQGAFLEAHEL